MATKTVKVSIQGGQADVDPEQVELSKNANDEVVWESDEAVVVFIQDRGQGMPTNASVLTKDVGPGRTPAARVRGSARNGRYKYDVAVVDGSGKAIGVDPRIMVTP